MKRTPLLLAFLFATPAVTAAQGQWPWDLTYEVDPSAGIELPVANLAIDQVEVADLDGDNDPDALVRDGSNLYYLYGIGAFSYAELIASTATSATIQHDAATGGHDVVLFSDANGLFEVEFGGVFWTTQVSSAPAFQGVSLMETGDLDGTGAEDLVIRRPANAKSISCYNANTSGGFTHVVTFTSARSIQQIRVMNWDGTGANEIVVRTNTGIEVWNQSGSMVTSFASLAPGDVIGVLPGNAAQPADHLIWGRRDATGTYHDMLLLNSQGTSSPLRMQFQLDAQQSTQDVHVTGFAAGDTDEDGDLELAVSNSTLSAVAVLGNRGGSSPVFTTSTNDYRMMALTDTPTAAGGTVPGVLTDVNVDSRADVVHPVSISGGADELVVLTDVPDFTGVAPTQTDGSIDIFKEVRYEVEINGSTTDLEGPLEVRLEAPNDLATSTTYHFVEVAVWKQVANTSGTTTVPSSTVALYFYDYDDLKTEAQPGRMTLVLPENSSLDFPAGPGPAWDDDLHYFLGVRFVEMMSTEQAPWNVGAASSWFQFAVTAAEDEDDDNGFDDNDPYYDYVLEVLDGTDDGAILFHDEGVIPDFDTPLGLGARLGRIGSFSSANGQPTYLDPTEQPIGYWGN